MHQYHQSCPDDEMAGSMKTARRQGRGNVRDNLTKVRACVSKNRRRAKNEKMVIHPWEPTLRAKDKDIISVKKVEM